METSTRQTQIEQQLLEETRRKQEERAKLQRQLDLEKDSQRDQEKLFEAEQERNRILIQEQERRRKEFQTNQQLANQRRQREIVSARLKEESRERKELERNRVDAQCSFPTQLNINKQPLNPKRMAPSERTYNGAINGQSRGTTQQVVVPFVKNHRSSNGIGGEVDISVPGMLHGSSTPALYFDRLVSEEVQELKSYARLIEIQQKQIDEQKKTHEELESRLEEQTRERLRLETTLEMQEREWAQKCEKLEQERDEGLREVQIEQTKNERLLDLVNTQNKEIHRMFQRKYDNTQGSGLGNRDQAQRSTSNQRNQSDRNAVHGHRNVNEKSNLNTMTHRSPYAILEASGNMKAVRERNATKSLLDFFGL